MPTQSAACPLGFPTQCSLTQSCTTSHCMGQSGPGIAFDMHLPGQLPLIPGWVKKKKKQKQTNQTNKQKAQIKQNLGQTSHHNVSAVCLVTTSLKANSVPWSSFLGQMCVGPQGAGYRCFPVSGLFSVLWQFECLLPFLSTWTLRPSCLKTSLSSACSAGWTIPFLVPQSPTGSMFLQATLAISPVQPCEGSKYMQHTWVRKTALKLVLIQIYLIHNSANPLNIIVLIQCKQPWTQTIAKHISAQHNHTCQM